MMLLTTSPATRCLQRLFGLIGAFLGGAVGGETWAFFGFVIGVGSGLLRALTARSDRLEAKISGLERRVRDLESKVTASPVTSAKPRTTPQPLTAVPPQVPTVAPPAVAPEPISDVTLARGEASDAILAEPPPIGPPPLPRAKPYDEAWTVGARWLVEFFTTGNVVAKVGIVILFFGAAFLVRYAADRGLLPIEYRLMGLVVAALVLQAVGWRLRRTRRAYAMALQGGAVGLLYLTIFAAFRLYDLLPALLTFALLLAVVALSVVLAVFQDAKSLAVLGTSGGFLAPILASTGSGDHVGLFSYLPDPQRRYRDRRVVPRLAHPQLDRLRLHVRNRLRVGSAVSTSLRCFDRRSPSWYSSLCSICRLPFSSRCGSRRSCADTLTGR